MKRTVTLLLTMALVMALLASCELMVPGPTERPSIGLPSEPVETVTPAPLPTPGPSLPVFVPAEYDPRYDCDPNLVYTYGNRNNSICATESTTYFAYTDAPASLYFLDKATGFHGPLCGKPECTHDNETCNAYVHGWIYALSIYDGRLYWLQQRWGNDSALGVYSTALDGTDRRQVLELDKELTLELTTDQSSGLLFTALFHRGWVYLLGTYQGVSDAEGSFHVRLVGIPLEGNGEARILFDMSLGIGFPYTAMQGYGDGLYVAAQDRNNKRLWLLRWNSVSQELETLYADELPDNMGIIPNMIVVDSSLLIGSDWETKRQLFRFDLEQGTIEEQEPPEWLSDRYEGMKFSTWYMSDGLIVTGGAIGDRTMVVQAKALEGNVLLEQTYEMDWVFTGEYIRIEYRGRDETNLYFYCSATMGDGAAMVIVSLNGSGAKILWDSDRGSH